MPGQAEDSKGSPNPARKYRPPVPAKPQGFVDQEIGFRWVQFAVKIGDTHGLVAVNHSLGGVGGGDDGKPLIGELRDLGVIPGDIAA